MVKIGVQSCPICGLEGLDVFTNKGDATLIPCRRCGTYKISRTAEVNLRSERASVDRTILSAMVRYQNDRGDQPFLRSDTIDELIRSAPVPRSPLEALDNLVSYLGYHQSSFSSFVLFHPDQFLITAGKDHKDFEFIKQMLIDQGLAYSPFKESLHQLRLTVNGWARFEELRAASADSRQAFVAMSFAPDVRPAYLEGIKPALEEAGYNPKRLDFTEHNEKIDDEIIAQIRRSGLLVADFTGNRGGVYFEAGFAMGLGIPVIWTCHVDWIDNVHVDVRVQNYIDWTSPADLRSRLQNRVQALYPIAKRQTGL
jgi:nucleoside 2-deoxyribosyltransferase